MNFNTYFKRNNFADRDHYPSHINRSHQPRSRRDPFEGDPFKIQSMNFRYADKPTFYPVSNRGKRQPTADKSQLKHIYYNRDHTIPKFDKENVPLVQSHSTNVRKSTSSVSMCPSRIPTSIRPYPLASSASQQLNKDSLGAGTYRKRNSITKGCDFPRSKSFIQPTASTSNAAIIPGLASLKKRVLRPRNSLEPNEPSESMTDINVDHNGSCHITIKINGVPKNRVHINKNDENVAINLVKPKKLKKLKPTKPLSPHELKPCRSYVIMRDDTAADSASDNLLKRDCTRKDLKESSTLSMIPHREQKSSSQEMNMTTSQGETIKAYSGTRLNNLRRNCSQTTIRNMSVDKHASMLEKILSNNPIVVQPPKTRNLFTRSKSFLGQRSSSMGIPGHYTFQNMNSKTY